MWDAEISSKMVVARLLQRPSTFCSANKGATNANYSVKTITCYHTFLIHSNNNIWGRFSIKSPALMTHWESYFWELVARYCNYHELVWYYNTYINIQSIYTARINYWKTKKWTTLKPINIYIPATRTKYSSYKFRPRKPKLYNLFINKYGCYVNTRNEYHGNASRAQILSVWHYCNSWYINVSRF